MIHQLADGASQSSSPGPWLPAQRSPLTLPHLTLLQPAQCIHSVTNRGGEGSSDKLPPK